MEEDGGKTGPSCRRVCVSLLSLLSVAVPFSKFSYTVSWKRLYNALSNKCNNKKIISGCLRFVFCQLSRKISWSLPPRPCRCFRPLPGGVHESGLFWYMYIYLFCLAAQHTRSLPAHFAHGGGDSRITKNNRSRMCVKSFGCRFANLLSLQVPVPFEECCLFVSVGVLSRFMFAAALINLVVFFLL